MMSVLFVCVCVRIRRELATSQVLNEPDRQDGDFRVDEKKKDELIVS
jgi:hypothetical protein